MLPPRLWWYGYGGGGTQDGRRRRRRRRRTQEQQKVRTKALGLWYEDTRYGVPKKNELVPTKAYEGSKVRAVSSLRFEDLGDGGGGGIVLVAKVLLVVAG